MRTFIVSLMVLVLVGTASALPPPKAPAGPAKPKNAALAALETEIKELESNVDRELLRLFSDQVQTGVYRSRLGILQREWQQLFAAQAPKAKPKSYAPPAPGEFAIDEAVGSDGESLEQAMLTSVCKKRRGCRIWARVSFGKELVKKGGKFEFSAEVKSKGSITKYAVPAKEMTISGNSVVVDLPLESLYIYKGTYEGTLKVLCNERYKSKSFSFELIDTY